MTFRLKDRELQDKLDTFSSNEFSKHLQGLADTVFSAVRIPLGELLIDDGEVHPRVSVFVRREELEEVPQYDPTGWSEWPNVTPPAHKLMRVEILTERTDQNGPEAKGGRPRFRGCARFDGQYWDFKDMAHLSAGETVRFRPWLSPYEEEKE